VESIPESLELTRKSGFEIVEIMGSWSGHPYRTDSHRMIVVLKKERRL